KSKSKRNHMERSRPRLRRRNLRKLPRIKRDTIVTGRRSYRRKGNITMKIYYDKDSHPQFLAGKKFAIIGYGSQGHAHANNLRDSGHQVVVGLRPSSQSWGKAENVGLEVKSTIEAVGAADVVMMLVPDETAPRIYKEEIAPKLRAGQYLAFAHGFSIHFGKIAPPAEVNVFMVAPK